jgi:cell surface protein SprA
MIGTRFDYAPSEELALGATFLNLRERPLTQKVNIGDEPVNNTIMGADFTYSRSSQFLTDLIDKLPLIKASAPSNINLSAEAAYLIPGHSRAVGKEGNAYIDDFEGSQSAIDIRSWTQWSLASTPKLQPNLFPEGNVEDSLFFNYNRARMNWYTIDPSFFGGGLQDGEVDLDVRSNHLMRLVENKEVFPNRQLPLGTPENLPTFDLTFDPTVRGPYNYLLTTPFGRIHQPMISAISGTPRRRRTGRMCWSATASSMAMRATRVRRNPADIPLLPPPCPIPRTSMRT